MAWTAPSNASLRSDSFGAFAASVASWSDSSALGPLATLAAKAPNESLRRDAFDGAVQAMQQNSGWLNAEQKAIVARLRKASLDAEQSRRLDVLEKGPGK